MLPKSFCLVTSNPKRWQATRTPRTSFANFWSARVNRRVIESVGMNIAKMINPLIQSVLNQNTEAEPWVNSRERCQCVSVMRRSEEASFRGLVGLRLGRVGGRASAHWAKSVFFASFERIPAVAYTVSGWRSDLVHRAITQGTWLDHITDEVPRCLPPPAGVTNGYKQHVKGRRYASVAGTVSYRPRLQGWQQRRSSGVLFGGRHERQNRKQTVRAPVTRTVSRAIEATKWPAGTSFRQTALMLRNILTGTAAAWDRPGTTS